MPLSDELKSRLGIAIGKVFRPAAPIDEDEFFDSKEEQMRKVVELVNQRRQHAIIFDDRGVGKTSLANILSTKSTVTKGQLIVPHVNCDSEDDFSTLWRKIFSEIQLVKRKQEIGF